jgi:hypothetical protein
MPSNLDRYKNDLDNLVSKGDKLALAMRYECFPQKVEKTLRKAHGDKTDEILTRIPPFRTTYQSWYSEAKALIRQLLPDRISDFVRYYEKPNSRKEITCENYTIADYLEGLGVTRTIGLETETIVTPVAAASKFDQQLAILNSAKARFESSLFDIRQLVQADLFDSELDAAKELSKHKFARAAGALAGVVIEKHLVQVCDNHQIKVTKKDPAISDLNDLLKQAGVITVPDWRFIQHLADIRNLCDHNKATEPTPEQVDDLIGGVAKIIKTIF